MSGSNKGKKIKKNGSKKNSNTSQTLPYEGAYGNPRLTQSLISFMGVKGRVKLRNGAEYEGLFHSFSPQMQLSLRAACRLPDGKDGEGSSEKYNPKEEDLVDELVIQFDHIVSMELNDVDPDYAVTQAREANGEHSSHPRGSKNFEKKLEPWNGGGDALKTDIGPLESLDGTNGWAAEDMFKANEEKYDVKTDYDSNLSSYTMQLNIEDKNPEKVARATQLAKEIESSQDHKYRADLELDDGVTEEDKFSAVRREREFRRDGRSPRDFHDRDGDHGGFRDKGDKDRDMPYRGNRDYNGDRHRNRGRSRDILKNPGFGGHMGSRSMGPGGQAGGDRRNQPISPMDGPPGSGGQKHRQNQQTHIPPRFTRTGSGGHSRDDERMKQNEGNSMHSIYQPAPKGQRRMNPRMGNNNRAWHSSSSDYAHHNVNPMQHAESPVMPGGAGPPLSRTSSSSSTASGQNRKHLSTSSQDDQQMHPGHHSRQPVQQSSSPTMVQGAQPPPPRPQPVQSSMHGPSPQASWAAVARGNPKPQQSPVSTDMSHGHMVPGSSGLTQSSSGGKPIHIVDPNDTYAYYPQTNVGQGQMQTQRAAQHPVNMPMQMIPRPRAPRPQQSVMPGTNQPRQQMSQQNIPQMQTPHQPQGKPSGPASDFTKHPKEKVEDGKGVTKKKSDPANQHGSSIEGIEALQEFHRAFRLSNEPNKEASNASNPNKQMQRQSSGSNQNSYQSYQQPYQSQAPAPVQQPFAAPGPHPEHPMAAGGGMSQSYSPTMPGQSQVKHPGVMQRPMQPSPMTQQIPGAHPSINNFSQNPNGQLNQKSLPNRLSNEKTQSPVAQKVMAPNNVEGGFAPANIHTPVSQISQSKPSAVISVSAAVASPIVSSHYQSPVTVSAPIQQTQRHSPTAVSHATPTSPVSSAEPVSSTSIANTSVSNVAPASSGKPLNPEANEFKPRTSAKPPVTARAGTPVQQPYVQQGQVIQHQMPMVAQMYPNAVPIEQVQMYQPIPPPFLQGMVSQIPGQQVPQFAFDQPVYPGHPTQHMVPHGARVAAIPASQQHVPQYPADQNAGTVYVPVPQQSAYMTQARPHSAHTPTQVTNVTAASPAAQPTQQPPQVVNHPPIMQTPHAGWMMVQGHPQQPPPQVQAQYINPVATAQMPSTIAMTNVTPQQKGQQPVTFMPQVNRQYPQYGPSAPNTQ